MKPLIDDQIRAIFKAKLIRSIDGLFLAVFGLICSGAAGWLIFGRFDRDTLVVVVLFLILLVQVWLLFVIMRVGFLVLQCHADIVLMPEAAARLALLQQRGTPPPK